MRIVKLTVSGQFLMSDKFFEMYQNEKLIENFKGLGNWENENNGDISLILASDDTIGMITEALQAIEIPFTSENLTDQYSIYTVKLPESYDGFGTFTIEVSADGRRTVAVQKRNEEWQVSRYASGLGAASKVS